ncbi:MAG: 50S ribosomal protein L11 methyltransferase [Myxococcales bacterium]|nr:50S ribosomal protein L11 methyltransferase [Myxococcales bacterium]
MSPARAEGPGVTAGAEGASVTAATVELRTLLPVAALAEVEPLLWLLSPGGILTEDAGCLGAGDLAPDQVRVAIYVQPAEVASALVALCRALTDAGVAAEVAVRAIEREDWNRVWKEHWKPLAIGLHLRVEPAWLQGPDVPGEVRLVIDPGLAFGTGAHETTRLALEAIERLGAAGGGTGLRGVRVLDVGTGSAILAILAVKLGATTAVATEVDTDAIEAARLNLDLNDVSDRIVLVHVDDPARLAPERFGLVIANIISSVLLPLRDALVDRLELGGHLVLSGILQREVGEVRAAYLACGLAEVEAGQANEWASLVFRAPL